MRITTQSGGKRVMDQAGTFMMMVLHIIQPIHFRLYIDGMLPQREVPTMSLKKAGMHLFQLSSNVI